MLLKLNSGKLQIDQTQLSGIKNIIFDLGGVIIGIHEDLLVKTFKQIGFTNFNDLYAEIKQTPLFELFETGKVPAQSFRNELKKFKNNVTDTQIDFAWNATVGDIPDINIDLVKNLRQSYRTFLLSNTNVIHMDCVLNNFKIKYGYNPLEEMFEQTYLSYEIGLRKPDKECFQYILDNAGIKANETLFIDDILSNVKGAIETGLMGYHLNQGTVAELFE